MKDKYTTVNWVQLRSILGWTYQWINNSIIMKSICFLFTKKESHHNFHCSRRYESNHCSLLFYAKTCECFIPKTLHTCMWSNSWKIYSQNKPQTNSLTAPSHSLLASHQEKRPRHLHPKNQSWEKAHEAWKNFTVLSFSRRLILTMPSLKNQPWMRSLPFNLLQL